MIARVLRFCLLLGVVCILSGGVAPPAEKRKNEEGCKLTEELPIGAAAQKYKFQYQSCTGKGCALYQVRNQPRGQYTTVHWKDDKETLLLVGIPRCENEKEPCEWIRGTTTIKKPTKRETQLAYGVNRDEYTDKPQAFAKSKDDAGEDKQALGGSLIGTIADNHEASVFVNIKVTSVIKGKPGNYEIVYRYSLGEKSAPITLYKAGPNELNVVWQSPKGKSFDGAFTRNIEQRRVFRLDHEERNRQFSFIISKVTDFQINGGLLEIYRGGARIAAIKGPAYAPKD